MTEMKEENFPPEGPEPREILAVSPERLPQDVFFQTMAAERTFSPRQSKERGKKRDRKGDPNEGAAGEQASISDAEGATEGGAGVDPSFEIRMLTDRINKLERRVAILEQILRRRPREVRRPRAKGPAEDMFPY